MALRSPRSPLLNRSRVSPYNLVIGKQDSATDRNFDGLIDEVQIFNRVLTSTEIQTIYNAGGTTGISLNAATPLTLMVINPAANTVGQTGIAFTDVMPAGLTVATPNALSNTCGGTPAAVAGTGTISLTGGSTTTPGAICTVVANVTGTASGQYTNTTGAATSTNGGTGNTASANLTVASPPSIVKAFGAATIPLNSTTSLTFNITSPNTVTTLTGIAFTDSLPAGLAVASPNNLSNTCGGTATATGGFRNGESDRRHAGGECHLHGLRERDGHVGRGEEQQRTGHFDRRRHGQHLHRQHHGGSAADD